MTRLAALKTTLKRGALVTAANWPVVLIQFVTESTFKLLLAVPVAGGILLVALALGRDVGDLLDGSGREIVTNVAGALLDHPGAFASFIVSAAVVLVGGATLTFLVKGGTVLVLAHGATVTASLERPQLSLPHLQRAAAFSVPLFVDGSTRLFPRYVRLGFGLLAAYALSGAAFLAGLFVSYPAGDGTLAWPLVTTATVLFVCWITVLNLFYLVVQMIVAVEECGVREAVRHARTFLGRDLRRVASVFVVVLGLVILATIGSTVAAAGLGLVSFVPILGLAVLPLQAAAWLVRGIVFQYLGLTALGAYLTLYRPIETAAANAPYQAWTRNAS
jgi:hypothetical protein